MNEAGDPALADATFVRALADLESLRRSNIVDQSRGANQEASPIDPLIDCFVKFQTALSILGRGRASLQLGDRERAISLFEAARTKADEALRAGERLTPAQKPSYVPYIEPLSQLIKEDLRKAKASPRG
jgi:hypothetical protein